ncbi:hypothetical protein SAMN05216342_1910 [Exiguobacterium indicum]|nr:hypothetical protein SAMN05216342_1910 [Exiguobacterium enclense]
MDIVPSSRSHHAHSQGGNDLEILHTARSFTNEKWLLILMILCLSVCMIQPQSGSETNETSFTGTTKEGFVFEYKLTNTGDHAFDVVARSGHLLNVVVRESKSRTVVFDSRKQQIKTRQQKKRVKASETVVLKQTVQGETIEPGTYDIESISNISLRRKNSTATVLVQ